MLQSMVATVGQAKVSMVPCRDHADAAGADDTGHHAEHRRIVTIGKHHLIVIIRLHAFLEE